MVVPTEAPVPAKQKIFVKKAQMRYYRPDAPHRR